MKLRKLVLVMLGVCSVVAIAKGDSFPVPFSAEGLMTGAGAFGGSGATRTGTIKGSLINTATITDSSNGCYSFAYDCTGGFVMSFSGSVTITTSDGSQISMLIKGTMSTPAKTAENAVYTITGGTGRFQGATGGGNYVVVDRSAPVETSPTTTPSPTNNLLVHIDGNISLPITPGSGGGPGG